MEGVPCLQEKVAKSACLGPRIPEKGPGTVWLSQLEREVWKKRCGDLPVSHCLQGLAGFLVQPALPGITKVWI